MCIRDSYYMDVFEAQQEEQGSVGDDDVDEHELKCSQELVLQLKGLRQSLHTGVECQLLGAQSSHKMRLKVLKISWQKVEELIEEAGIATKTAIEELPDQIHFDTYQTVCLMKNMLVLLEDMYNGEIKLNVRTKKQTKPI
eukprot:TRINITY_DN21598_c0_g1_i1.p1 TRINITY_DN21598_c0_g1~~TRINITY_DN21598_c0_g1_i1.p1  ORF type:complete len:140 (-),score=60.24 TRINITY_DN21598_c0_g1_i1:13-432(-)